MDRNLQTRAARVPLLALAVLSLSCSLASAQQPSQADIQADVGNATLAQQVAPDAPSLTQGAAEPADNPLGSLVAGPPISVTVESDRFRIIFTTMGAVPTSWKLVNYPDIPPSLAKMKAYYSSADPQERMSLLNLRERLIERELEVAVLQRQLEHAGGDEAARLDWELRLARAVDMIPRDDETNRWFGALAFPDLWWDSEVVYEAHAPHATPTARGGLHLRIGDAPRTLTFAARLRSATVYKEYTFHPDSYRCDLSIRIQAGPDSPLSQARNYMLYWGPGINQQYGRLNDQAKLHTFVAHKAKVWWSKDLQRRRDGHRMEGQVNWLALEDQYFAAILLPQPLVEQAMFGARVHSRHDVRPWSAMYLRLSPGMGGLDVDHRFGLYVGPKEQERLDALGADTYRMLFYGMTGWLSRIMLSILRGFYSLTGNYGLAIICLTIVVRILLFPIAHKQFKHMKEMQSKMEKMKPRIDALKEEYADDPQKLSQEQTKLMLESGVMKGQMKGCLTMFLQLPIFISLFYTLQLAIELRGASFFGWMNDLSQQDALFYLPFALFGAPLSFNVLPIVNCAITWIQIKKTSTSATMEPSQKMIMNIMPIFLLVFLWTWPSGLFIYWTCSSLFGFAQQYYINATYDPDVEAAKAEAKAGKAAARREARGHVGKGAKPQRGWLGQALDKAGVTKRWEAVKRQVERSMREADQHRGKKTDRPGRPTAKEGQPTTGGKKERKRSKR